MKHVCARCGGRAVKRFEVHRIQSTLREYRPRWWAPLIRRRYACYDCTPSLIRELKANGMDVGTPERIG